MGLGLVDTYLAYKFIKLLATPWKKTEAYKLGIIDAKGKRIKTEEADDAARRAGSKYTNIHKVIFNIKRLVSKVPGGKTRLGGAAAALWLLKEEAKKMGVENANILEDVFLNYLEDNDIKTDGINESFSKIDLSIPRGTYILNGRQITLKENLEIFDTVIGISLFRLGEEVFSQEEIERAEQ
jgi:hypothetical protein